VFCAAARARVFSMLSAPLLRRHRGADPVVWPVIDASM